MSSLATRDPTTEAYRGWLSRAETWHHLFAVVVSGPKMYIDSILMLREAECITFIKCIDITPSDAKDGGEGKAGTTDNQAMPRRKVCRIRSLNERVALMGSRRLQYSTSYAP